MVEPLIEVEIAYALRERQTLIPLSVAPGTTVAQAIEQSAIKEHYPDIDLQRNKVGVFSRLCKLDQELRAGDRVEIYRALIADPKEVRKKRAAEGKVMKKGG